MNTPPLRTYVKRILGQVMCKYVQIQALPLSSWRDPRARSFAWACSSIALSMNNIEQIWTIGKWECYGMLTFPNSCAGRYLEFLSIHLLKLRAQHHVGLPALAHSKDAILSPVYQTACRVAHVHILQKPLLHAFLCIQVNTQPANGKHFDAKRWQDFSAAYWSHRGLDVWFHFFPL